MAVAVQITQWIRSHLRSWKWCLVFIAITFLAIIAGYYLSHWTALKYGVVGLATLLLALFPELSGADKSKLRIGIAIIAAIALVTVQQEDDRDHSAEKQILLRQIQDLRVARSTEENIRQEDLRVRNEDRIRTVPEATLGGLTKAQEFFRHRASVYDLSATALESDLLIANAGLATNLLSFPHDPLLRAQAYRSASAQIESASNQPHKAEEIASALERESDYEKLALYYAEKVAPNYSSLLTRSTAEKLTPSVVRAEMESICSQFRSAGSPFPPTAIFAHSGSIAIGCGNAHEALGFLYQAVSLDQDNLKAHEALAYSLWIFNHDYQSALESATTGLQKCEHLISVVREQRRLIHDRYENVAKELPDSASNLANREKEADAEADSIIKFLSDGSDSILSRFQIDYVYFNALAQNDKAGALQVARTLYQAYPNDADIEDALGLVLMMLPHSLTDFDEAKRLFTISSENPSGDATARKLADFHLSVLDARTRDYLATSSLSAIP